MHIVYDVIFEAHGWWILESIWSSRSKVLTMSVIKDIVSVFSQGQEKPIERYKSRILLSDEHSRIGGVECT